MTLKPQRTGGDVEETINRYKNSVYGLALAKTGSRADADDVFQEVFLAYFESGKTFRDEEHKKAWLLRTAMNMCLRITASTWRKKTVPLPENDSDSGGAIFIDSEENRVWAALSELSEEYRLPIYLHYFQGLSTEEIGKALSVRPGTVRMRLSRGREKLREKLSCYMGDNDNE